MINSTKEIEAYCIKEGYRANTRSATHDSKRKVPYWASRNFAGADFQWHVYKYAARQIRRLGLSFVIDVGCGTAEKLNALITPIAREVIGIDQASVIDYCRARYTRGTYLTDDFENPQLQFGTAADCIICSDVIEHVLEPNMLLEYIRRLSSDRTYVIFSTPDRDRLRGPDCMASTKAEHVREWTANEFRKYLTLSGFKVIDQFHQPPLRFSVRSAPTFLQIFGRQLWHRRPFRYNQVLLCQTVASQRSQGSAQF